MEIVFIIYWPYATRCWFVLLSGTRLGHSNQFHHGFLFVFNGVMESQGCRQKALENVSIDAVLHMVHG